MLQQFTKGALHYGTSMPPMRRAEKGILGEHTPQRCDGYAVGMYPIGEPRQVGEMVGAVRLAW